MQVIKTLTKIAFLTAVLSWVGCTTVQIKEVPQFTTPNTAARIAAGENLAVLTVTPTETDLEAEAVECIRAEVAAAHPAVGVITANEFRRSVFPYRIPYDEGERLEYLDLLIRQPVLRERMAVLKIRYLVVLSGITEFKQIKKWSIPEGPPPPGQFGVPFAAFFSWDRITEFIVSILDVNESQPITKLYAEATGKPWVWYTFIFPIGSPAFTETEACKGIGQAVANFLSAESLGQIKSGERSRKNDT